MSIPLVKETLEVLESGQALSNASCKWLTEAFQAYRQGCKLDKAFGLDLKLPRGGRFLNPLLLESYDRRNQALQKLAASLPGTTWARAKQIVAMIEADPGNPLLSDLVRSTPPVPKSHAQIARILAGETTPDRFL